ncbi:expressed unknown protein [Seminavis robusta]|uniref:Uncharacterized protein n=1 Tax=Seminavis robusta TaxID=568900 RepID=A0A9N8ETM3_9STRA|nr:expressed unknown protein [Seminavis robusta]|eukprot:Sro2107_g314850.1 n/a (190) ;mRNA; f:7746-8315
MDDWFHINGKPNEKMEDDTWYRTEIAGFLVRYRRKGISAEAHIYLDGPKERLTMKTYKGFVRVDVPWRITPENYKGAVGMLGSFDENGARNGRDGKHIGNHNEFGQEWQVREDELKLFNSYEGAVSAPEKCKLPEFTMAQQQMRKRRLAESTLSQEDIEKACAHLPENQRSACEYDVIATQDIDMASVW